MVACEAFEFVVTSFF